MDIIIPPEGKENDFPPSYFFQFKDWNKMKAYNEMAARMMELNSGGKFWKYIVYYPIETFWKYYRPIPGKRQALEKMEGKILPESCADRPGVSAVS